MAEKWVKDIRNQVRAEAHSRAEVAKSPGALKQKRAKLSDKLVEADKARLSAKANLKTIERQVQDQRQKLHITEIELVTQK